MAVQVIGRSLMTSDQTDHQAKSVGSGGWVVSFLPGRTLTIEQATAAIQAAEAVAMVGALADQVGLTTLETVGLAIQESPWASALPAPVRRSRRLSWLA
ncbi:MULTISPECIES: hypothetical protein [Nocardia]|jgi:hypothetical protein|uniref:Uncharacterized protein n=1 Tax=Nocardia asteroides NBRC 15531 TaxID=1110697 RepID=U5EJX1_NOCAS|nr:MULTISPECIES: hypothetical protein [Nocardia]TLF69256.1 hypothetical protein FEK33_02805 [Nocardia asteroides NBRC 15531]UGT48745.1 hypothetical protein LT345_30640 [Nocardia asteroides]UGT52418.1 hypothetical protein LTT85_16880 [Nocardia asteroides]SFL69672.1 hypothetical protein SAMN05444423_101570 [Nocardia asteroides]VEG31572.1 Uncharacterised protein [Nocardia asteroides]